MKVLSHRYLWLSHWLACLPAEMTINFAFTLEVVLVCIAAGGPKEYLRSPWNIFDFTMVLVG